MDSLEQKIEAILLEGVESYGDSGCLVTVGDMGTVIKKILALLQPVEGELAECPSPSCRESAARKELGCGGCIGKQYAQAQRAHMIAQGYHLPKDCCIGCTEKEPCAEMIAHDKAKEG